MHAAIEPETTLAGQTRGRTLDHAAALYDLLSPLVSLGRENRIQEHVLDLLHFRDGCRILDVGCATGKFSRRLAEACARAANGTVVAIDAAAEMIAVARRRQGDCPNLRFETALAEALPFPDGAFDHAVASFFFHHVDADLKARCLREIHRTLADEGTLCVVDVDRPTTWLGRFCAWSGYVLFRQDEIRENIDGVLLQAFDDSPFRRWQRESHHCGYISIFRLWK